MTTNYARSLKPWTICKQLPSSKAEEIASFRSKIDADERAKVLARNNNCSYVVIYSPSSSTN